MSSEATAKEIQTEVIRIDGLRGLLFARHREVLASSAPDERLLILLATLLKLRKQARACLLLAQEFMVEETLATTRTITEVIVNAAICNLQIARNWSDFIISILKASTSIPKSSDRSHRAS
jgi:hypothetical protein